MTIVACTIAVVIGFPLGMFIGWVHDQLVAYVQTMREIDRICTIAMFAAVETKVNP